MSLLKLCFVVFVFADVDNSVVDIVANFDVIFVVDVVVVVGCF